MGRRGPKPTPKDELARRGSWRAKKVKKKRAPKRKPVVKTKRKPAVKRKPVAKKKLVSKVSIIKVGPDTSNRPTRPQWLVGNGKKMWDMYVNDLVEMGVLTKVDREKFARICFWYAEGNEANEEVKEKGLFLTPEGGNPYPNPAIYVRDRNWDRANRLANEFGLSPLSREALSISPPSGEDVSKSRFFKPKDQEKNA